MHSTRLSRSWCLREISVRSLRKSTAITAACILFGVGAKAAEPQTVEGFKSEPLSSVGIYGYSKYRENKPSVDFSQADFKHFDALAWKALSQAPSRLYMFTLLLRDYNLIGMKGGLVVLLHGQY